MIRLETVEDFERVDEVLSNPDSKLSEYCVVDYGYCEVCQSLRTFSWVSNPTGIRCHRCDNTFWPDHMGLSYFCELPMTKHSWQSFRFRIGGELTDPIHPETKEWFSRESQLNVFKGFLDLKIKNIKSEQRRLGRSIRRLAKLR